MVHSMNLPGAADGPLTAGLTMQTASHVLDCTGTTLGARSEARSQRISCSSSPISRDRVSRSRQLLNCKPFPWPKEQAIFHLYVRKTFLQIPLRHSMGPGFAHLPADRMPAL